MSKTASSASSVGASFENTTAIMATMQESTRESSKNIGTALKSIISRYGELKSDPRSLMDSEGEELGRFVGFKTKEQILEELNKYKILSNE